MPTRPRHFEQVLRDSYQQLVADVRDTTNLPAAFQQLQARAAQGAGKPAAVRGAVRAAVDRGAVVIWTADPVQVGLDQGWTSPRSGSAVEVAQTVPLRIVLGAVLAVILLPLLLGGLIGLAYAIADYWRWRRTAAAREDWWS